VSPRNSIRRQANRNHRAETGLEQLFTKAKHMDHFGDTIYWSKQQIHWKQLRYDRTKKAFDSHQEILEERLTTVSLGPEMRGNNPED
jgi:hypothetical protein